MYDSSDFETEHHQPLKDDKNYLMFTQRGWLISKNLLKACNTCIQLAVNPDESLDEVFSSIWNIQGHPDALCVLKSELESSEFYQLIQKNGYDKITSESIEALYQFTNLNHTFRRRLSAQKVLKKNYRTLKKNLTFCSTITISPNMGDWSDENAALHLQNLLTSTIFLDKLDRLKRLEEKNRLAAQAKEEQEKITQRLQEEAELRQKEQIRIEKEKKKQQRTAALLQFFSEQGLSASHFPWDKFSSLSKNPDFLLQFVKVTGQPFSLTRLRKFLALDHAIYTDLASAKKNDEEFQRQQAIQRQAWESSLLTASESIHRLGILEVEFFEWRNKGRLACALEKNTLKSGKSVFLEYFDPQVLGGITEEQIERWRNSDLIGLSQQAIQARMRQIERLKVSQRISKILQEIDETYGVSHNEGPIKIEWTKRVSLPISIDFNGRDEIWSMVLVLNGNTNTPTTLEHLDELPHQVSINFSDEVIKRLHLELQDSVSDLLDTYTQDLKNSELTSFFKALKQTLSKGIEITSGQEKIRLNSFLPSSINQLLEKIDAKRVQDMLQLKDYPKSFMLARSIKREIFGNFGPTNSGKTHDAIMALTQAKSGLYLAPLRLLAMEIRDRLMAQGIPCNLLTGEEHVMVEGAQHTACTIEMMNSNHQVDVAVIDEIQMLEDPARGWAWTAAIVGAPAKKVYLCGSASVEKVCEKLIQSLDEPFVTQHLQRKNPLVIETVPERSKTRRRSEKSSNDFDLQPGDAVVAFSRKDVLTLSARFRQKGFTVSTIYGALAPEVRRTEAERFVCGESEVVVATDAIGMGLNLPIRRVVFSSIQKFDGVEVRDLLPAELQQIAGRAGRFGLHDEGRVTVMHAPDLDLVKKSLYEPPQTFKGKLAIAPNFWHIEQISKMLVTEHIGALLNFFCNKVAVDTPLFETASLEDATKLGHHVDQFVHREKFQMSLMDRFTFSCAPVSIDKEIDISYFDTCLRSFISGKPLDAPRIPIWMQKGYGSMLEDAEQISKELSLYAWLSFKFPNIFHDGEFIPDIRSIVSRYIEQALLHQNGFGVTTRESNHEIPNESKKKFKSVGFKKAKWEYDEEVLDKNINSIIKKKGK